MGRCLAQAYRAEFWTHQKLLWVDGEVGAIDLPIVWYSGPDRLEAINAIYRRHGFAVCDAHVANVEGGGGHQPDYGHLAWKKRLDPKGRLNAAKSLEWPNVKHLSADEIEALDALT